MEDMTSSTWRKWPMSIIVAADELLRHISEDTKQELIKASEQQLVQFQHLAQYTRNSLGLWEYYKGREEMVEHPDMLSYRIIHTAWLKLIKAENKAFRNN